MGVSSQWEGEVAVGLWEDAARPTLRPTLGVGREGVWGLSAGWEGVASSDGDRNPGVGSNLESLKNHFDFVPLVKHRSHLHNASRLHVDDSLDTLHPIQRRCPPRTHMTATIITTTIRS